MSINTAVFPQQGQPIPLGRQGESNARTIVFDIHGWLREYGEGGTFLLLHKRPNDQAAYLVPFTMSPTGTELFWTVSAVDTDKDTSGSFGEAELRYEVTTNNGTTKVKSDLYRTMVAKSLDEYNPRYPDVPEPEGGGLILRPVLERPTIGEENVVYLVPNDASEDPENVYVEWIYVNNAWEEWGKYTADVDIASKADLSYVNAQLELKQDKISATGTTIKPVYFSSAGTATPIPGYVPDPSNDNPLMDGTTSPGISADFSRKDHCHPHDSTKQDKLVVTGSAVQGVYVSASGEVSAMTYSLNKTVPANAVFTDTTYDPATASTNGLMSSSDKAKLDGLSVPSGGISMPITLSSQSIASFQSSAAGRPLRVTATIEAVQSGSGDPSPSNVRPITGWTGANITVSPNAQGTGGTTYTVTFPSSIGTIYDGTLDVARGLLTVTREAIKINAVDWTWNATWNVFYRESPLFRTDGNVLCECYRNHKGTNVTSVDEIVWNDGWGISRNNIIIRDTKYGSDLASFLAASGNYLISANLANPITYQLSPQQIVTLAGTNNVFADCGPVSVTHWPGTGTPVEPVEDASEIEWKKGILARIEALEAGE